MNHKNSCEHVILFSMLYYVYSNKNRPMCLALLHVFGLYVNHFQQVISMDNHLIITMQYLVFVYFDQ